MVESSMIPITNLHSLNQPHTSDPTGDLQLPAPTHGSDTDDDCALSIIEKSEKQNPPSKSARNAIEFYFRWTIIVFNVGLELAQIILTLEASGGRIKGPTYRTLTATTSSICLLLSVFEVTNGVVSSLKKNKKKKKRGAIPIRIGFAIWFGLVSSSVQFSVNVTALVVKRAVVNFDYLGLLFSVCYFFAAINGERRGHVAVVNCVSHGSREAKGKFVDGIWVFQCPLCIKHA